jgi:hypothetical protein
MTKSESEIRAELEGEKGTMRRQALIKALWKLNQQTQAADSSFPGSTAIVHSGQGPSSLRESGTFATSC